MRRTYFTLASLVVAALAVPMIASGDASMSPQYPDLVSEPPERIEDPSEVTWHGETFLAVRFDGYVSNLGQGPVHIAGNPATGVVSQQVETDSGWMDVRAVSLEFESGDGHNHWHVEEIMEYSLWTADGSVRVAPAAKIDFCLFDAERISDTAPMAPTYTYESVNYCNQDNPDLPYIEMGITPGWRDVYPASLNLQWIDVSDVEPGVYRIGAETDPADQILEADETNNGLMLSQRTVVVPGYVATSGSVTSRGDGIDITLATERYGLPGPARFSPDVPLHGTLTRSATAETWTYEPDPGFWGKDAFSFTVRDVDSPYPRQPSAGTIDIAVQPFLDVQTSHVFLQEIGWMLDEGITRGCDVDRFCPEEAVSRAQVASLLARALDLPEASADSDSFVDDDGSVYEADIERIASAGITVGCDVDRFCPEEAVSRAQVASLLARALDLPEASADSDSFVDDDGSVYEADIERIASAGITVGCDIERFCPDYPLTRDQFAAMLERALNPAPPPSMVE